VGHEDSKFTAGQAFGSAGRSVRLFLADGSPQGLIVAEIPNWSGKVLAAPRARLGDLLKRGEASRTGIYVLTGPDPERPGGTLAYIGEADDVAARLRIHVRSADKDFFDRLAIVVSSDENLTKAHARYLESRVIRMTRQAGAVALANGTEPDFQRLPEADRADMEFFSDQLSLLLPLAGFDLFRRTTSTAGASPSPEGVVFTFSTAGATAVGKETEDGFVVLAGSTARRAPSETFPRGYLALRIQLVAEGKLVAGSSPDLYTFAADVAFTSPSAAASIVAARSASGPREWRVKETGELYGDWRAARLDE
jgi:hypothetical protein